MIVLFLFEPETAAAKENQAAMRVSLDRFIVIGHGPVELLECLIGKTAIPKRNREMRIEPYRLVGVGDRPAVIPPEIPALRSSSRSFRLNAARFGSLR